MLYQLSYVRVQLKIASRLGERRVLQPWRETWHPFPMRRLGGLALLLLVATGCGGHKQSKADRAKMNAEFAQLDWKISNWTMGPGYADQNGLEQVTRRYVAATRKYHDDLGDREVKRRLTVEANQLAPWCPPCVDVIRRELKSG